MIYADSSFLVAFRVRHDTYHATALKFYQGRQEEIWLWSPWHRVEVLNTVRQLTRHPEPKRRLSSAEAKALMHYLERDVRLGYFTHMEADWRDVLRTANEISLAHGFRMACRSADLLHVAYAKELSAELFVGFDNDQLSLARAAGLRTLKPA
jgi:predicted nucleic acid-binding protein